MGSGASGSGPESDRESVVTRDVVRGARSIVTAVRLAEKDPTVRAVALAPPRAWLEGECRERAERLTEAVPLGRRNPTDPDEAVIDENLAAEEGDPGGLASREREKTGAKAEEGEERAECTHQLQP